MFIRKVNPFAIREAKTGLTIWKYFSNKNILFENIWTRNVNQQSKNNSPSNIL